MRTKPPPKLESARETLGMFASARGGMHGRFVLMGPCGASLMIVSSSSFDEGPTGWEHVSVSVPNSKRCPNWPEMCFVKDLFWDDEEAVMQLHPPRSEYVNNHASCLHLWRPVDGNLRLPSSDLVGIKGRGEMTNDERVSLATGLVLAAAGALSGARRP